MVSSNAEYASNVLQMRYDWLVCTWNHAICGGYVSLCLTNGVQVAPTHLRGTLGSVNQLVICFGILGALVCNIALPATQWRTIFGLTAIPAILLFLGRSRHVQLW